MSEPVDTPPAERPADRPAARLAEPVGWLADGTAYYAPLGELVYCPERDRVRCHLCGRWLKALAQRHLPLAHEGWTRERYTEAFGLERGNGLARPETRRRLAEVLRRRMDMDARLRDAMAEGARLARSGELSRRAATRSTGRRQRPEHARKSRANVLAAVAATDHEQRGRRATQATEQGIAERFGFPSFAAYWADRRARAWSLAAIARETGRNRTWVHAAARRHEPRPGERPGGATPGDTPSGPTLTGSPPHGAHHAYGEPTAAVSRLKQLHADQRAARLAGAVRAAGFDDVGDYLRTRHVHQGRTVHAMVTELGVWRELVMGALAEHGVPYRPRITARAAAEASTRAALEGTGFADFAAYYADRRARGWTLQRIAAECGHTSRWVRARAGAEVVTGATGGVNDGAPLGAPPGAPSSRELP